jgi:ABC-type sugar transport system permease subunit
MTSEAKLQQPGKTKKRKAVSLERKKSRSGYLFVAPFLIGLLCVYIPIIFNSIKFSFCNEVIQSTGVGFTISFEFAGLEHYRYALLSDSQFTQTLLTGLETMIINIPCILFFSLFMALLLNQKIVGRAAFRAIFFVPVILSTGIMSMVDISDMTAAMDEGVEDGAEEESASDQIVSALQVQRLFANMKVGTGLVTYVVGLVNNIFNIVDYSGVQILIFLAGLQSISPSIYESCRIDGATGWETFWKITFPMVSPMILVNAVYTLIDAMTMEDNEVMTYISQVYAMAQERSSAMAWIYFVIIILIVAAVAGICSAFVFYQRRDK